MVDRGETATSADIVNLPSFKHEIQISRLTLGNATVISSASVVPIIIIMVLSIKCLRDSFPSKLICRTDRTVIGHLMLSLPLLCYFDIVWCHVNPASCTGVKYDPALTVHLEVLKLLFASNDIMTRLRAPLLQNLMSDFEEHYGSVQLISCATTLQHASSNVPSQ